MATWWRFGADWTEIRCDEAHHKFVVCTVCLCFSNRRMFLARVLVPFFADENGLEPLDGGVLMDDAAARERERERERPTLVAAATTTATCLLSLSLLWPCRHFLVQPEAIRPSSRLGSSYPLWCVASPRVGSLVVGFLTRKSTLTKRTTLFSSFRSQTRRSDLSRASSPTPITRPFVRVVWCFPPPFLYLFG